MLLPEGKHMLETYDPQWQSKWDRAYQMMRQLEVRERSGLTTDEEQRLDKLRRLLPVIFDARHRTANEYIRFQLSLALKEADRLDIRAWLPTLPDSAGIDEARAAVAEVIAYIEATKHRREMLALCHRADSQVEPVRPLPSITQRIRWALLRFRLGRAGRSRRTQNLVVPMPGITET